MTFVPSVVSLEKREENLLLTAHLPCLVAQPVAVEMVLFHKFPCPFRVVVNCGICRLGASASSPLVSLKLRVSIQESNRNTNRIIDGNVRVGANDFV